MENNNVENVVESVIKPNTHKKAEKSNELPAQFYDESGEIILDKLIEDYLSLVERDGNLVEQSVRQLPNSYEEYDIKINNPIFQRDDEILKRLFDNGFTNNQVQMIYDLADQEITPMLDEMTIGFEAQKQKDKLISHFGSNEKFEEVARQISVWAKENIQPEIYEVLGSTYEGVLSLYKMMSSDEPSLGKNSAVPGAITEEKLREMMKDPKYWRDKDKTYISQIQKGFEKLYPNAE